MLRWIWRLLVGCKHDWRVVDKVDMPSAFEQIMAAKLAPKTVNGESVYLFTKQATTVLACSRCGATEIVRTRNLTRWD